MKRGFLSELLGWFFHINNNVMKTAYAFHVAHCIIWANFYFPLDDSQFFWYIRGTFHSSPSSAKLIIE
jgi:hypothetical protein